MGTLKTTTKVDCSQLQLHSTRAVSWRPGTAIWPIHGTAGRDEHMWTREKCYTYLTMLGCQDTIRYSHIITALKCGLRIQIYIGFDIMCICCAYIAKRQIFQFSPGQPLIGNLEGSIIAWLFVRLVGCSSRWRQF